MKKILATAVSFSLGLGLMGTPIFAAASDFSPFVDDEGQISRPSGIKTNPKWIHLGAWVVANEGGEGNGLHNVYTTRAAAASFRKNGIFPDGAPLVKEVSASTNAALATGQAHWATDTQVWFVSIKDSQDRFPDNPIWGNGWGWALFKAEAPDTQVATDYKEDCLSCHVPAQNSDWMYVSGYVPVLGPKALLEVAGQDDSKKSAEAPAAPVTAPATASAAAPAAVATTAAAASEIDLDAARKSFKLTCSGCHSDQAGRNSVGPSLAGVIGRKVGTAPKFNYSPAMKASSVVWSAETMDQHLTDVRGFIPNNRMGTLFPAGVKDDAKRAEIIAYLESISK